MSSDTLDDYTLSPSLVTPPMDPAIKARWIEALNSGEYTQTTGTLHRIDATPGVEDEPAGYCCLGVLCDLAVKDGIVDEEIGELIIQDAGESVPKRYGKFAEYGTDEDGNVDQDDIYFETANLPTRVKEWAGLRDASPKVWAKTSASSEQDGVYSLILLNDHARRTFSQIAEYIEGSL